MINTIIKDSIKITGLNSYPNNSKNFKKFTHNINLVLPEKKPDILNIISCMVEITITDSNLYNTHKNISLEGQILTENLLLIEGFINEKIEYTADKTQIVYGNEFNIPFSTYIILSYDYFDNGSFNVSGCIEDIYLTKLNNRTISQNTLLHISYLLNY